MTAIAITNDILVPVIKTVICAHCGKERNRTDCKYASKKKYSMGKYKVESFLVCDGACSKFYETNDRIYTAKRKIANCTNPFNRRGMQW